MKADELTSKTSWPAVALLFGAGVVAALQVGKAPIALPGIRAEFAASLSGVAWVLSAFPLVGAMGGLAMGVTVTRLGPRVMLPLGLALLGVASLVGGMAPALPLLLATRVAEGIGLLIVTVAAPALMAQVTYGSDRVRAFGLWGCFMPTGTAVAMAAAPLLGQLGWRGLWLGLGGLGLAYAAATALWCRRAPAPPPAETPRSLLHDLAEIVKAPGPRLLAATFACYTVCWAVLTGFLPTLMIERMGVTPGAAGMLTAAVAAANILGNLATGPILARTPKRWLLSGLACATIAACTVVIFDPATPGWLAFGLSLVFTAAGGLLPACVIGGAAATAPNPRLVPAALGFVMQGSNLGLVLGPVLAAAAVEPLGWGASRLVLIPSALLGILLALRIRKL